MNSFTLTAVGQLARNPELVAKGSTTYTRFCLVGNDYAGKDEEGAAREIATSLWFVAFGALGEAIARHTRKGDQLFVEARVRGSNWTDKQGEKQYDHSFFVQGFRFGAPGRTKREERDARRENGHGPQRTEERANGRDRSSNNGAYLSLGGGPGVLPHAGAAFGPDLSTAKDAATSTVDNTVGGTDEPVVDDDDANPNNEAGTPTGADSGSAATVGPTVGGNEYVGAGEGAGLSEGAGASEGAGSSDDASPVTGAVTSRVAKDGRRVAAAGPGGATKTASRAGEKTRGTRSSRRPTASAA